MTVLTVNNCGGITQHSIGAAVCFVDQNTFQRIHIKVNDRCFALDAAAVHDSAHFFFTQRIVVDQQIVQQALEHVVCKRCSSILVPSGTDQERDLRIIAHSTRNIRFDSFSVYIQGQFLAVIGHSHMLPCVVSNRIYV